MKASTLIFAHNSGLENNIHYHKTNKPIQEDQDCRHIRTGPNITKTVADFRKRALMYYNDNYVKEENYFPPCYYLQQSAVKTLLEKLIESKTFSTGNVKFLSPYNPVPHLKLLGLEDRDCDDIIASRDESFEDVVLAVDFDRHLLLIAIIVTGSDRGDICKAITKLDDVTKTVLHVASDEVKNDYLAVVSMIALPDIDNQTLRSFSVFNDDYYQSRLFWTQEDWDSRDKFDEKLDRQFGRVLTEIRSIKPAKLRREDRSKPLQSLCGEFMSSMAFTTQFLPKVTDNVSQKIDRILLNRNQINLINDPAKWKIIKGPFGSGLSSFVIQISIIVLKCLNF